jgi:8-oxo-dGTP pyrophosphatase MutT (NUDIX family)
MNKYNICNNCSKTGHLFHQCKQPITSYGVIAYRFNKQNEPLYLMIRRKQTFAYIELIRGKYQVNNKDQIVSLLRNMTNNEKQKILNNSFEQLWQEMWGHNNCINQYKREELTSQKKFINLQQGIINGDKLEYSLGTLLNEDIKYWEEPEWEFPKGRKNYQEKDVDCGLREFQEETGYNINDFNIIDNLLPFEEIFIASNNKSYRHDYYLAYMCDNNDNDKNINKLENFQKSEVSKIEWKTLSECIKSIRYYNIEKIEIIKNVDNFILDKNIFFSVH